MKTMSSDAVSPVVGVMLMLVVTIIIAAVVSAYSGGLAGAQQKTPQATLKATYFYNGCDDSDTTNSLPDYSKSDYTVANGFQFENTGGDPFNLNDLVFTMTFPSGTSQSVAATDVVNKTLRALPTGATTGGYFQKIGNTSKTDTVIATGDKFRVNADNCYISGTSTYISMWPDGFPGRTYIANHQVLHWTMVHNPTGRSISSGDILIP
ncbi:MAG: type IV pilin N-terminal domain-containing protein [Methanoregula sp.]|nr:type IV pilin N-terminal domain-containing protein [Methanoregula sp.]